MIIKHPFLIIEKWTGVDNDEKEYVLHKKGYAADISFGTSVGTCLQAATLLLRYAK